MSVGRIVLDGVLIAVAILASNLRYGTQAENEADKIKHGTAGRGGRKVSA